MRLEDHVNNLLQRRDHLLAVNARLAIPLTSGMMNQIRTYQVPIRAAVFETYSRFSKNIIIIIKGNVLTQLPIDGDSFQCNTIFISAQDHAEY